MVLVGRSGRGNISFRGAARPEQNKLSAVAGRHPRKMWKDKLELVTSAKGIHRGGSCDQEIAAFVRSTPDSGHRK